MFEEYFEKYSDEIKEDDNSRLERRIFWNEILKEYVVETPLFPSCTVSGNTFREAIEESINKVDGWLKSIEAWGYKKEIFYKKYLNGCSFINNGFVTDQAMEDFDKLVKEIDDLCDNLGENSKKKDLLELRKEIVNKKKGMKGENKVAEALQFCEGDMYVYRDITLDKTEIDFIVITHKNIYVIECKNWNSDVLIDAKGGVQTEYESISYRSPIDQNLCQLSIVKKVLKSHSIEFEYMEEIFQPLVVFINLQKKVEFSADVDDRIVNQVIRLDSLVWEIQKRERNSPYRFRKKEMNEYAMVLLDCQVKEKNPNAINEYMRFCNKYATLTGESASSETDVEDSLDVWGEDDQYKEMQKSYKEIYEECNEELRLMEEANIDIYDVDSE